MSDIVTNCSFCRSQPKDRLDIIAGIDSMYICDDCNRSISKIVLHKLSTLNVGQEYIFDEYKIITDDMLKLTEGLRSLDRMVITTILDKGL